MIGGRSIVSRIRKTRESVTPLDCAVAGGHEDIAEYLHICGGKPAGKPKIQK